MKQEPEKQSIIIDEGRGLLEQDEPQKMVPIYLSRRKWSSD